MDGPSYFAKMAQFFPATVSPSNYPDRTLPPAPVSRIGKRSNWA